MRTTADWQVRCTSCGATREASDVGVLRLGAWSWIKRAVGWCSHCRGLRLIAIEHPPPAEDPATRLPHGAA